MTRPLAGCRVLDFGIITAGAATSALLADLGAEVLKVESPSYLDPFRIWTPSDNADPSAQAPFFRATNRGKLGVSLDAKQASGREALLRLVAASDVVVENFRRGVLERMGLGFKTLAATKAGIILASISSQGETGPLSQYVSYGSTLEAVAGLASLSGEPDGPPVLSGKEVNLPDQLVAMFAAAMIVTAWRTRLARGDAVHLDLSQRELTSFMVGEAFLAERADRLGTQQSPFARQECVAAADGWLAVSITPAQLPVLVSVLATASLADWCASRSAASSASALAAVGIAAAPVLDGADVLATRGESWSHAFVPTSRFGWVKGMPFSLDSMPFRVDRDAPRPGADTATVLATVAGLAAQQIDELFDTGAAAGPRPEQTRRHDVGV